MVPKAVTLMSSPFPKTSSGKAMSMWWTLARAASTQTVWIYVADLTMTPCIWTPTQPTSNWFVKSQEPLRSVIWKRKPPLSAIRTQLRTLKANLMPSCLRLPYPSTDWEPTFHHGRLHSAATAQPTVKMKPTLKINSSASPVAMRPSARPKWHVQR